MLHKAKIITDVEFNDETKNWQVKAKVVGHQHNTRVFVEDSDATDDSNISIEVSKNKKALGSMIKGC
jgi:hypothetical protein